MAKVCGCFGSEGSTNLSNLIKSIMADIEKEDNTQNVDTLIQSLDSLLLLIKAPGEAAGPSTYLESLASVTESASQIIDHISEEADKMSTSVITKWMSSYNKELGHMAVNVLKGIGETHWIFLGLSLVASSLQRYQTMKSNNSECVELLDKLVELAKDAKKFKEAVPGQSKRVLKAFRLIVVGVMICCHYIRERPCSRYLTANTMNSQLQKTEQTIRDIRDSLTLAGVNHTAGVVNRIEKQITKRYELSPLKLLDFNPEGIDDQATEVAKMLDMEGSEPRVAVVLWGHGGIGKSTLAASVIQDLYSKSTDFKFSTVIIDQRTSEKRSHIVQLQTDIIFNLGGGKVNLPNPQAGRQRLQEVMENKACFLYIDNAVDSDIKELLPQFETEKSHPLRETEESDLETEKENSDPLREKQKTKLRILITSRENNLKQQLNIKKIEDYHVQILSPEAARNLLTKTILHGEVKFHEQFNEESLITAVAQACHGVPILLSVFGNHLRVERKEGSYKDVRLAYTDVLQALQEGKLDKYSYGDEELLSKKLFFVYDKMRDEEAKEAFLDICTHFHGCEWDEVAQILNESTLRTLLKGKLVNRSESDTVIVHDVLRSMGKEKAKPTRLSNYEEFLKVKDDATRLQNIKGLALLSTTSLTILDCKHLNAMHNSLRVLKLGNWVKLDGSPCENAFQELKYLEIGDLRDFPFEDVSKLKKLAVFHNSSKPGMELGQLPPNLKHMSHQVPYQDCNAFTKIPLKDLKSLERFHVRSMRSVCLPQGFKFPASLVDLDLTRCKTMPKSFGKLTALQTLIMDECDMEYLPQGFEQLTKLRRLSMERCTNLITLPDRFGSSDALIYLSLRGCTRLEKLPADLKMLRAVTELNIAGCENLSALPDVFDELSALQKLDLTGCISLHRLPDSFGRLQLESLDLHLLSSLEELPKSFGDLPCLTNLSLLSCDSLKLLPKIFARLKKLEALTIEKCNKLTFSNSPFVTEVPDGFQALPNLKILRLIDCSSVVILPMGLGELSCLEELRLSGLPLSSLPDGLGKLKNLKLLWISFCYELERVSQDFENLVSLETIRLYWCAMLDGTTMDKIVKLQHCHYVDIERSTKLIERWNEIKKENEEHFMVVDSGIDVKEFERMRRVSLFHGQCIQLDSTRQHLIYHPSMSVSNNTTVVVMSGELHQGQFKPIAKEAIERAKRKCSGQLLIIHVCTRAESDGQTPDKQEEMERIRQILMLLPPGVSYVIPSTDIRRLRLLGKTFFGKYGILLHNPVQQPFACYMADWMAIRSQILLFYNVERIQEDDIAGTLTHKLPRSESSDEENEVPDKIEEFINFICESRTPQSLPGDTIPNDPPLPSEGMIGRFFQALRTNGIHHFLDSNQQKVEMDQLEGKHLAVIMIDLHSPECKNLQEIYSSIQQKDWNFEAIWITLFQHEDFGLGSYSRAIQGMPGIFLPDPKSIKLQDIKNKSPRIIIFNQEGDLVNLNALPLIMAWGADAYPFTENVVSQIISKIHIKSSLDVLFHGMNFSTYKGIQMEMQIMNNKCIFLYAEPPCPKFRMNSMLEQCARTEENLVILYVGSFFCEKSDAESVIELYENATQNIPWPKLSFVDMMKFWYRCKCLFSNTDKMEEKAYMSLTSLERILKHLLVENRWLILLDRDGVVTANGRDVVEILCRSNEEVDDVDTMMKMELGKSLQNGKCEKVVRTFFNDEISDYPHHQHPLMLRWRELRIFCNRCYLSKVCAPHEKRIYTCEACDWDLCRDCWEVFAKEKAKASLP